MGGSAFGDYQGNDITHYFREKHDPSGFIDGLGYDVYYKDFNDAVKQRYEDAPRSKIAIEVDSKTWNAVNATFDLTFSIRNDSISLPGSYRYNVVITEDKLIEQHHVDTNCAIPNKWYGTQAYDTIYQNNWVARKLIYWSEGRHLAGPGWNAQEEITHSLTDTLKAEWIPENCSIVIKVYKECDSIYKCPVLQVIKVPLIDASSISGSSFEKKGIMNIYPNPVKDHANIHILIEEDGPCSLSLFDMNGQSIKQLIRGNLKKGKFNVKLNTNNIPAGTYMVVMETGKRVISKKLLVL